MANLNLSPEILEGIKGICSGTLNTAVLDAVAPLSKFLNDNPSDNPMEEKIAESCNNFQATYNSVTESIDKVTAELMKIDEIREYLERKDNGEVAKREAVIEAQGVDKSFF